MDAVTRRSASSRGNVTGRQHARQLTPVYSHRIALIAHSLNPTVATATPIVEVANTSGAKKTGPTLQSKTESGVHELDPKSFYDFISGDDLCVVDYYTDWCGPCQMMHKELSKMTAAFQRVRFAKLNCGNCQDFSSRQRIRALPTFRLYYKGTCLDEITGAKPTQLRQLLTHYLCMTTIS